MEDKRGLAIQYEFIMKWIINIAVAGLVIFGIYFVLSGKMSDSIEYAKNLIRGSSGLG